MSNKQEKESGFRWIDTPDVLGEYLFTFDGKKIFNMYEDYPYKLTKEQKEIFDAENPFWADYFSDRTQTGTEKQ